MGANVAGLLVRVCLVIAVTWSTPRPGLSQETTPAAEPGTVSGVVVDRGTGDPIIEAGVEVVGQRKTVRTDLDGRYSIRLPPGTYELRFYAPYYRGVRLPDVTVKQGEVSRADAALESAGAAGIEIVEVVAPAPKAAEAAQIAKRKEAAVVSDTISRETMAKSTGSEASDVVQRAPAVTVRDNKFIFVRGLSERYTSALLNRSRLPSPDPLRRAVPLDLFPTDFLDAIGIIKTFSPDLPGDFSGGLVDIDLRDLPDQLTYSLGVSTGANTNTTFKDFLTYRGSPLDYLASGRKFRALSLPPFDLNELPIEQRLAVARGFQNIWTPRTIEAPPNAGGSFSVGNRFGPFGFQLGGLYGNEWQTLPNQIVRQFSLNADGSLNPVDNLTGTSGVFEAKLGGVLTAAYQPTERHRFTLRTFVYQKATDETNVQEGVLDDIDAPRQINFLQYIVENLAYLQLAGEDKFTDWLLADWRTVVSRTTRDEPDTRETGLTSGDPIVRTTNATIERLSDTMVDFTVPFRTGLPWTDLWSDLPAKFRFGPAYSYRRREFAQREFGYRPNEIGGRPIEEVLAPDELVPGIVEFQELTDIEDTFEATQEIIGGYGLFDLPIVRDRLRVVGGARYEYSLIRLDSGVIVDANSGICPPPDRQQCFARFRKKNVDPLPGLNVIVSPRDDMNFRLSYSQSVARPEFRELAPAIFPVAPGERPKRGNPGLVQTEITSYDARWEWFVSPLELVSLGFFYKKLDRPIELVTFVEGTTPTDTWINGGAGDLIGFEFEGRKNFGFINERLRPLSFNTNVTWSDSTVDIPPTRIFGTDIITQQTSTERPLVGQAPFIINGAIEYTDPERVIARLLYYTAAPSLFSAGSFDVPDIFFERRDQLDAVVIVPLKRWLGMPISARLSAENILNTPFVFTQGGRVQNRFTTGVKFTFGLSLTQ